MPLIKPPEQTYNIETGRQDISAADFSVLTGGYWESPDLKSDVVSESSCYVLVDKVLIEPGDDYKVENDKIWIKDNGDKNIFIRRSTADESSVVTILYRSEKAYETIPSDFIKQFENTDDNSVVSKYLVFDETDKKIKLSDNFIDKTDDAAIEPLSDGADLDKQETPGFYAQTSHVILVMTTTENNLIQVRWSNAGVQEIRVRNGSTWTEWNKTITEADGIMKGTTGLSTTDNTLPTKIGLYYFNHNSVKNVPNMPAITGVLLNTSGAETKGLLEILEGDDGFHIERIFMTYKSGSGIKAKVFYRIVSNINDTSINWYEVKTEEFTSSLV